MKRTNCRAAAAMIAAAALFSSESPAAKITWDAGTARMTTNISELITREIVAETTSVSTIATPTNYAILKSARAVKKSTRKSSATDRTAVPTNRVRTVRDLASPANYALLKQGTNTAARLELLDRIAIALLDDEDKSESGRRKWHGGIISQAVDTVSLTTVYFYSDSFTHTDRFQERNLTYEVSRANAKLLPPPMTNGVPRSLAEARMRRHHEKGRRPPIVLHEVNATRGKRPKDRQ